MSSSQLYCASTAAVDCWYFSPAKPVLPPGRIAYVAGTCPFAGCFIDRGRRPASCLARFRGDPVTRSPPSKLSSQWTWTRNETRQPLAMCADVSSDMSVTGTNIANSADDAPFVSKYNVGDSVRVAKSVIMYHIPTSRNEPFDMIGRTGVVEKIIGVVQGVLITATSPVVVRFTDPKVTAHLNDDELEPA